MGNANTPEGDKPAESKSDRMAEKIETNERSEAASELRSGSLNKSQVAEKRLQDKNRSEGENSGSTDKYFKGQRVGLYDGDKQLIPENKEAYKLAQASEFSKKFGSPDALQGKCRPETVLSPTPIGRVEPSFNQRIQDAIRTLPENLKGALKGFQIYTSQHPQEFVNEARNHNIQFTSDERDNIRTHIAATCFEDRVQNFSESFFLPETRETRRFDELFNLKGTVAHEALHALNAKQGFLAEEDPKFDELYMLAVKRIMDVNKPEELGWLSRYIVHDKDGNLVPDKGKEELFCDLGAAILVGEVAPKLVETPLLQSLFTELNEYMSARFRSNQW